MLRPISNASAVVVVVKGRYFIVIDPSVAVFFRSANRPAREETSSPQINIRNVAKRRQRVAAIIADEVNSLIRVGML